MMLFYSLCLDRFVMLRCFITGSHECNAYVMMERQMIKEWL